MEAVETGIADQPDVMTCPELEFNLEAYLEARHSTQKSPYEQMEAHGTETDIGGDYGFWFIKEGFLNEPIFHNEKAKN